jgi:glycerol kinase
MGSTQESFVGSIDQGTTSTRFLIFNRSGEPVTSHQIEFKQIYPQPGYVSITPPVESNDLLIGI